jgi:hypothetical protein
MNGSDYLELEEQGKDLEDLFSVHKDPFTNETTKDYDHLEVENIYHTKYMPEVESYQSVVIGDDTLGIGGTK